MISLPALSARLPVWFCDIWGVVHDGIKPRPETVNALRQHRRSGGCVALVTNAPRLAAEVIAQLDAMGVDASAYDVVATSGEATRSLVVEHGGGQVYFLGPSRDDALLDGLNVQRCALDQAKAVVATGLFDDLHETPADYAGLLKDMLARKLPMICANPDKIVMRGERTIWCAGALADDYAKLGGRVLMAGKPFRAIYDLAHRMVSNRLGRDVQRAEILAIGDGPETDMPGASDYGIEALLVADGISGAHENLDELLASVRKDLPDARIVGAVRRLHWPEG